MSGSSSTMLTGRQLRAARALLGMQPSRLAERMRVETRTIRRAESVDGECPVTLSRARSMRSYLEGRGIELLPGESGPAARFGARAPAGRDHARSTR